MATETTTPDAPFLSIRGLRKTYGQSVAIDGVSLDIREGEFMTFLGPSGSGKSTTLYITAGFQDPTEGTVQLAGKPLLNVPPNERNIGMVFQRYTLFPHLSVAENVAFPLRVRGWERSRIAERVQAMLKLVHLHQHGDRKPSQLSGGQQQRVAIARALAYNPPVLLMDEPLSALDKQLREEIQFELKRIHHDTGITILYVTHDQEEALRLSDRIAVFNKGRIEQVGTGHELYEHPATRFVAGFIGHSNFLPVKLEQRRGGLADVVLPDGRRVANAPLRCDAPTGADAALMLRPDRLSLQHAARHDGPSIPVRVTDLSYLGDVMQVHLSTAWEQDLDIRVPLRPGVPADWQIGSTAHLSWDIAQSQVHAAA
ncbi:polyamine ABC transporter ATP-binding protein (plasmid) [Aquabacterium olei]|uniref:Polyamine ABC transporter ATP-binding protein n=1 Tax=Aquabacterium olei TaxID=1296669 RepID=A0A2U8FZF1_9BURK|nr:ABC transporter ATP-binding protein [Aquabacterium olei]AWI55586.1 polyamine ABC transporter ATP-binding protein [Aquabacterium olei]